MTQKPLLTDTAALKQRRARHSPDALFLHQAAADDLHDRIATVNKTFTNIGVVTGFADFWAKQFPNAQIIPDKDTLSLAPHSLDLAIHALSLHWANDPVGQIIQCRRALRPDGLFLAACFGGRTLAELRACLAEAEVSVAGGMSPRVAPMADLRDLGALLQRAGLNLPVADTQNLRVEYDDAWHLMRDIRAMGEANALTLRLKRPTKRRIFETAADIYQKNFANGDRIVATFELAFLAGWAPDASQPKPLRPGSASARLADALGTTETKLPN